MDHLDVSSVHLPSFPNKKLKLIFIKYTDTVSSKEITCPHSILETVMYFEQMLLEKKLFTLMAVYIISFNIHTITVVNTANKHKLWAGGLSLHNKPFQIRQVRNLRKKKFWPAQFLTYTTSVFYPLSSDFLGTAVCVPGTPFWEVQTTSKYSWF